MSIEAADRLCANQTAPRVSLQDIENSIVAEYSGVASDFFPNSPIHASLTLITVCFLVLDNGYVVVGKSAPASADNFNPDLGRHFARDDAIRQIWPLKGFALRDKLMGSSPPLDVSELQPTTLGSS